MASPSKNILIFGGTGVIGKFITQGLLNANPSFDRVAIFTSASTAQNKTALLEPWKQQGLEIIVGDITSDSDVLSAYKGFDTVVSAVGRNVIGEQINLLKLAEQTENIVRFFPSEYGTDIEYSAASASEKPHQQKLKVRKYIRESVKRLEYTYLVTGPYADLYVGALSAAPDAGSFDVEAKKAVLLGDGEGNISLTTMADVGKLLVAALRHPEASRNAALKVNSYTTTPAAILAEFEKQTGGEWEVRYTGLEELKRKEKRAWEEGKPLATVYTLRRIWTEGGTLYERRDNEKIGLGEGDMETLEESVAQAVKERSEGFRSGKLQ